MKISLPSHVQNNIFTAILLFVLVLLGSTLKSQDPPKGLKKAIQSDDAQLLTEIIDETNRENCYTIGQSQYNVLSLAVKYEATNCVTHLIKNGIDPNANCGKKTPLMYAAKYGQLDIMKTLVDAGADVNAEYKGRTVLDYARKYVKPEMEKYLVSMAKE